MAHSPDNTGARKSSIGFAELAILRLVANRYPKLDDATQEGVQNAIDPIPEVEDRPELDRLGKNYKPRVDVLINKGRREIIIRDNGDGVSIERYEAALANIGESQKGEMVKKLGEFGLGAMSPFDKCEYFTFMSSPRTGENPPFKWTLNTADIKKQQTNLSVPGRPYVQSPEEWWTSELRIYNYTQDKLRSAIEFESFCTKMVDQYNEHMKRKKLIINVSIKERDGAQPQKRSVKWMDFTGVRLDPWTLTHESCGTTAVQLYLANPGKSGKPKGRVTLRSSSDYGCPLGSKALSGLIDAKLLKDLKSGIFEGDIRFDKPVEMEPSRRWFVENEALYGAVDHVETWIKTIGLKHIDAQKNEDTKSRWERTGATAQGAARRLLRMRPDLGKLLENFLYGHVGKEHANIPGDKDGTTDAKSTDGTGRKPRDPDAPPPKPRNPNPKPRAGHTPVAGTGKGGQPRQHVKGHSKGLILERGQIQGSNLWALNEEKGIVTVNVYHFTWQELDRTKGSKGEHIRTEKQRDKAISDIQVKCMSQALIKLLMKAQLAAYYGSTISQTALSLSIQDSVEWIETSMTEILKLEAFFIAEADRLSNLSVKKKGT